MEKIHSTQQMALREGWMDNVTNLIFNMGQTETETEDLTEAGSEADRQKVAEELKKEFRREESELKKECECCRKCSGAVEWWVK